MRLPPRKRREALTLMGPRLAQPLTSQLLLVEGATRGLWQEPSAEILRLYFGVGRAGAGPLPQVFTTWTLVREDTRWICQHALPPVIGMLESGEFNRDQIRLIAAELFRDEAAFLAWLGLPMLAAFIDDFLDRLDGEESVANLAKLGQAVEAYTHRLQNWTTHYFPWALGALFPKREPADLEQLLNAALGEGVKGAHH